jgi:hypothetical protein
VPRKTEARPITDTAQHNNNNDNNNNNNIPYTQMKMRKVNM